MDTDDRHRLCETARLRAERTVQELWLRDLALGGNPDEFDIDGYLQGVLPLDTLEQDILAVALNEQLGEIYRAARVPVAGAAPDSSGNDPLPGLIEGLLDRYQSSSGLPPESPTDQPPTGRFPRYTRRRTSAIATREPPTASSRDAEARARHGIRLT